MRFHFDQEGCCPCAIFFRSILMAAARISASGDPTNVAFPPSPIHLVTAFNNDWLSHKYSNESHPLLQNFLLNSLHRKESAPSSSRQPSLNGRRVSSRVCKKSGYKRIKTYGTYHGQAQTLCTPSQLQRVGMSAPCCQEYSRRPCCSMLTNAYSMKMLLKKLC